MIQQGLDQWFLRQDVIDQLLQSGDDDLEGINAYADRILMIAQTEEAEHQTLEDPFDRSVALVLSLVSSEGLDAWNIDLTSFLRQFMKRVKSQAKSLDLPDNFIERAYEIRNKYSNSNNTTLDSKGTSYNAKKIKNKICEICNINQAVDTHHLQFQEHANKNGFINEQFNKNHKANLISICEICHNKIHKQNKQLKKIKTSQGYDLVEI